MWRWRSLLVGPSRVWSNPAVLILAGLLTSHCSSFAPVTVDSAHTPADEHVASSPAAVSSSPSVRSLLSPTEATRRNTAAATRHASATIQVPLDATRSALLSLPVTDKRPQPLLVIAHGAGGNARTHCALWRKIVGSPGFLLCLRGKRMFPSAKDSEGDRYFYTGHDALNVETQLALKALRQLHGDNIDYRATTFIGYSQGASMGARFLPDSAFAFQNLILIEGGVGQYEEWTLHRAKKLREKGSQRVALVCGRQRCLSRAKKTQALLEGAGIQVLLLYAKDVGHSYRGTMPSYLKQAFAWIYRDDPRWLDEPPGALQGTAPQHGPTRTPMP